MPHKFHLYLIFIFFCGLAAWRWPYGGSPWQLNKHFLWLVPSTYTCHRIPIRNKTNINLETGLNHSCFLLPVFFCFLKALHLKLFNVGKLVISNNILKQQLSFMLHKKMKFLLEIYLLKDSLIFMLTVYNGPVHFAYIWESMTFI